MPTTTVPKRWALALLAVPLLLGLAGCAPGASTPKDTASSSADAQRDYQLSFAECMRDQGIDYPDPPPADGGAVGGAPALDAGDEATVKATETCTKKLGDAPVDEAAQKSYDEAFQARLALAKCLRENGIDFPDPKPGEGFSTLDGIPADIVAKCSK